MIIVASNIFPQTELAQWDYTWPIKRTPSYNVVKQVPVNRIGEVSIPLTPWVTWEWDYNISFIKGDAQVVGQNSAWHKLVGFYGAHQGSGVSWYYQDPYDTGFDETGTPVINNVGIGDGATLVYQTFRQVNGLLDLIQNYAAVPTIYLNGFTLASAGVGTPAPAVLSQVAGGTLGATTYFARITYVSLSGETLGSTETNFAVSANNLLQIASPTPAAGLAIAGYNVYVSTTTGTETKQNASPIPIGTSWTEPASGLIAGSALPSSDTTGWTIDNFGNILFSGPPANTVVVAWSGQFYFRCYFDETKLPLQEDLKRIWSIKSLKFHSALR